MDRHFERTTAVIQQLTNASAYRTIIAIAVVATVTWLGDLATGQTTSASSAYYGAALLVVYVVVDHLHGIRAALNRLESSRESGLS
jgi:hypothetical protein